MKKFIILLALIFSGNCVFATDFNVYQAKNGQIIIVKQVKSNPIVVIDTWVKTGSINENDQNTGVSHFLEHLFFKGTKRNPLGTFDRILESKGAVTNAATSKDFTHYYIKIPSKDFDLALELHADMLLYPAIPQSEMDRERKVVLEEIAKDKNSPNELVYENLTELIYKVHPYKREVIGKSAVIENITRDEIFDYYNKHYVPENMITVVVGDVDPDYAAKKIEQEFCKKSVKPEKVLYKKEPPITQQRVKIDKFACDSGYMMIGFRGTNAVHKDEFALDILASILGDGRSSRFYQNIKEQKQLVNSISVGNGSFKDDGIFYISSNFQPENKDKVLESVFEEIKKIQECGVTQEEVERAKSIIVRDSHYSRESVSNIAMEMGYTVLLTGDAKNYDKYLEDIKNVTPQEVQRAARKYLGENKSAVSVVLPENFNEKKCSACKKIEKNRTAKLVKSAYNTDKYELDNGATLLLNQHQVNDIIAISILAKGGTFFEKTPGVASLMSATMIKGTQNYSQNELAQIMEENGIKIMPSSGADSFVVDVVTTKEEFKKTLDILDEVINRANFATEDIDKARKIMLNSIKAKRDVPINKAMEEYNSLIYEGSVYSNTNKILEKTLPKITQNQIKEYYNTIFYPQNLVISVNGDVDKNYVINKMSEIFNSKNGTKFEYTKHSNDIPKIKTMKKLVSPIKDLQTAWLFMGWQTDGTMNQKDFATLQVIDSFMGTGMSSRLFRNLREKQGLAYQVGSGFSPNVLRGKYTIYIGTNPATVKVAKDGIMKQIQILKTQDVGEEELQNAKDLLIGQYILALETNLDKAGALANYEASGRGFEFINKYADLIQSVTAKDIKDVANKYFNENYVESLADKAK